MGFTRSSLLPFEQELELAKTMEPLWATGFTAKQIAEELRFSQEKDRNGNRNPYEKLKPHSAYLYKQKFSRDKKWILKAKESGHKFSFKRRNRGIPEGHPHYNHKQTEILSPDEFALRLNINCPKVTDAAAENYNYSRRKRAYCLLTYWSPLRKSEIFERLREDFTRGDKSLKINLWRKKKYHDSKAVARAAKDPTADKEPFFLYLGTDEEMKTRMLDELVDWVESKKKGERVFDFEAWTARNYIKDVFGENYYPHFGRANFITKAIDLADNPGQLVTELLDDTRMDIQTIVKYIMQAEKNRSAITKRELEKMNKDGLINA